jgi:DNA-binding NtrC family response regulator
VILAGRDEILPIHLPSFAGPGLSPPLLPQTLDSVNLQVGSSIAQAERALIEATMRHTEGNRTRAAAILGISIKTLFNKLRDYGTPVEE